MLYILEGPDGSGKTTLAEALCECSGYDYLHAGGPDPTPEYLSDWYKKIIQAQAMGKVNEKQGLVLDRVFPVSDIIYDNVLQVGRPHLLDTDKRALWSFLRDLHVLQRITYIACVGTDVALMHPKPTDNPARENLIREKYGLLCSAYMDFHMEVVRRESFKVLWYMPRIGISAKDNIELWIQEHRRFIRGA